jgi:hypothetical protein
MVALPFRHEGEMDPITGDGLRRQHAAGRPCRKHIIFWPSFVLCPIFDILATPGSGHVSSSTYELRPSFLTILAHKIPKFSSVGSAVLCACLGSSCRVRRLGSKVSATHVMFARSWRGSATIRLVRILWALWINGAQPGCRSMTPTYSADRDSPPPTME